jgi:hypothetical protein
VLETGARLRFWHDSPDALLDFSICEPRVRRNRGVGKNFLACSTRQTGLIFQAKRPALPAKYSRIMPGGHAGRLMWGHACQQATSVLWREGARCCCVWLWIGWRAARRNELPARSPPPLRRRNIYGLCSGRDTGPAWQYGTSLPTLGWKAGPIKNNCTRRRSSPWVSRPEG